MAPDSSPRIPAPDLYRRLIDVGNDLFAELDIEALLLRVVEAARDLTSARYAALGVLDRTGRELERFIYLGIDDETRATIGNLPRGRGVLGELIREPRPLRLADVNQHPHAYGFPPGHPPMSSFLGVPILIHGEAYGNLYMTEKEGGEEFDEEDQAAATTLSNWAGIAIENARLYTTLREREAEVERALGQAEASVDIARTVGGETDVDRVLDLTVKRARALVEARAVLVLLPRAGRIAVAAQAGAVEPEVAELEIPSDDAALSAAMEERVSRHLERGAPPTEARLRERLGAETALVVPLLFRGRAVGAIVALDHEGEGQDFDNEDLRLLQAFAASAATAVATAQSVESDRLQQQVEIGERERRHWAQELHDDALQGLAAIRIVLATALQGDGEGRAERIEQAAAQTVEHLAEQIDGLSRLVNDLAPASLERLGLGGALEALAEESALRGGIPIEADVELSAEFGDEEERAIYRLVQEALNNVLKHSRAASASVTVRQDGDEVRIAVVDDGAGFDPEALNSSGHGLTGMRERIKMLGGQIEVASTEEAGTRVQARVPVVRRG